jgi:hypothetical protein
MEDVKVNAEILGVNAPQTLDYGSTVADLLEVMNAPDSSAVYAVSNPGVILGGTTKLKDGECYKIVTTFKHGA